LLRGAADEVDAWIGDVDVGVLPFFGDDAALGVKAVGEGGRREDKDVAGVREGLDEAARGAVHFGDACDHDAAVGEEGALGEARLSMGGGVGEAGVAERDEVQLLDVSGGVPAGEIGEINKGSSERRHIGKGDLVAREFGVRACEYLSEGEPARGVGSGRRRRNEVREEVGRSGAEGGVPCEGLLERGGESKRGCGCRRKGDGGPEAMNGGDSWREEACSRGGDGVGSVV